MADLFFPEVDVNERATALGLQIMPATFGEGFGAAFEETLTRNPVPSALRAMGRARYREGRYFDEFGNEQTTPAVPSRMLSPEEANERYGVGGRLKFDAPTPEPIAENLHALKVREIELQDIRRRAGSGIGTALSAGLVGSLLDPLNIALAFVPVVGPARTAAMAARIGVPGARAATGAIEGAVGAALIEPLVLGVAMEEQADYTAVDSLANIVFGSAIGGGLHFGAGFIGDRIQARVEAAPLPRFIDELPHQDQVALLRTAVAQAVDGRPVDVSPVMDAAYTSRSFEQAMAEKKATDAEWRARLSRMTYDELEATRTQAVAHNDSVELEAVTKFLGEEKAREFVAIKSRKAKDRWLDSNLDDRTQDYLNKNQVPEELPRLYQEKAYDFDTESPEGLGRSIAVDARGIDAPGFMESPEGLKFRNAINYAREQDWDLDLVLRGMRGRAVEWAGQDASELFGRIFKQEPARRKALEQAIDKAHEPHIDPADQKGIADVEQRLSDEATVKDVDDETKRIMDEVTELESYLPEGVEPSQAVRDATKEASLFNKAWRAAAACGMRKS